MSHEARLMHPDELRKVRTVHDADFNCETNPCQILQLLDHITVLTERTEKAEALVKALVELAQEMAGYVKPYGLSDEGAKSEFDKWKECRDRIAALARATGTAETKA